ncbi:Pycsar system effector family protein [Streptomyces sp. NPDC006923]|uniref:Pycsar system effector family protein n=1 Tax=Streptomyces sp. NPDC006923 TaxID=3155355 RepID=UPI0033C28E2D
MAEASSPDSGPARHGNGGALARTLLMETREELAKADQKSSLLLASLGVAVAALIGALSGGVVDPLRFGVAGQLFFWTGCGAAAVSLVLLGAAVLPRIKPSAAAGEGGPPAAASPDPADAGQPQVNYFGDIADGSMSLARIRAVLDRTDPVERDVRQFAVLATSVAYKYRCIRLGMVWGLAFLALTLLGAVLGTRL